MMPQNATTSAGNAVPSDEPLFTTEQATILSYLHFATAPLSAVGSAIIVYSLLIKQSGPRHLRPTARRLILGLSLHDLVTSLTWVCMVPWASPVDNEEYFYVAGARGDFTTCSAMGFLMNFQCGASLYSAFLALSFLMQVRFEVRQAFLAKWLEPCFHIVPFLVSLTTGVYATAANFMNPIVTSPGLCWLAKYPNICGEPGFEDVECLRGGSTSYYLFSRILGSGTIGFSFLIIVVSMVMLVAQVLQSDCRLRKYQVQAPTTSATSSANQQQASLVSDLKRTKAAGVEALLYIGSYFVCAFPVVLMQIFVADNSRRTYLFVCGSIFRLVNPLQGFLNFLVYFKKSGADANMRNLSSRVSFAGIGKRFRLSVSKRSSSVTAEEGDEAPQENVGGETGACLDTEHPKIGVLDFSSEASGWSLRNLQRSSYLFKSSEQEAH